jgi:hypothetical protein
MVEIGSTEALDENSIERHRGRWVAVRYNTGQVTASAATFEELRSSIDRSDGARLVLRRIPRLDEPIYTSLAAVAAEGGPFPI